MNLSAAVSAAAPDLDETQPIPGLAKNTPKQQVLGFLLRVDAGEIRVRPVPEGAKVTNVRFVEAVYSETSALVSGEISWTLGGKYFIADFSELISIV